MGRYCDDRSEYLDALVNRQLPGPLSRALAIALIGALVIGATGWLHVDDDRDALLVHDQSAHRIEAASGPQSPAAHQHCYVCDWFRLLREPATQRVAVRSIHLEARGVDDSAPRIASFLDDSRLPARAPSA